MSSARGPLFAKSKTQLGMIVLRSPRNVNLALGSQYLYYAQPRHLPT